VNPVNDSGDFIRQVMIKSKGFITGIQYITF